MLTLVDKDFKTATIFILNGTEGNMVKMNENVENLSRELPTIKKRTKWKFYN